MKSCRDHCFVVFPLSKVATKAAVTGIRHKHNRVGVVVINGLAYGVVFCQSLDVTEGLVMFREPVEFNAFAGEI